MATASALAWSSFDLHALKEYLNLALALLIISHMIPVRGCPEDFHNKKASQAASCCSFTCSFHPGMVAYESLPSLIILSEDSFKIFEISLYISEMP